MKNFYKPIEYKMPIAVAKALLKDRNTADLKMQLNDFLCKIVNEQYGLLGNCVKVITF